MEITDLQVVFKARRSLWGAGAGECGERQAVQAMSGSRGWGQLRSHQRDREEVCGEAGGKRGGGGFLEAMGRCLRKKKDRLAQCRGEQGSRELGGDRELSSMVPVVPLAEASSVGKPLCVGSRGNERTGRKQRAYS